MSYNLLSPAFSLPSKEFEDFKAKNLMNGKFNMNGNGYVNGNNHNEYHGSNINLNKPNYQNFNQRPYNNQQNIVTDKPAYPQYISPNTTTSPIYQEKMDMFYQSTPKKNDFYLPDLEYQPLNHFKPHSIHQNLNSPRTDPKYYKSIDPKAYTKKEITVHDENIDDTLDKSLNSSTSNSSFISQEDISNNSISNLKANPTKTTRKKLKNEMPFDLNSHDKPPYSYATLIGISILSNADKKLTLSQIYNWISSTFKYYKREDVGWQNSIRHNLSLNKAFSKGEKSKDGKGHYWIINDGFEDLFLKKNFNNLLKNNTNQEKSKLPSSPIETVELPPIVSNVSQKRHAEVEDDEDEDDENDADMTRILEPPTKHQKLGDPFWELPKSLPEITVLNTQNSPPQLARRNLTYSSSFSCNSNLEFSPIRSSETGPLLEPITPGKNLLSVIQPNNLLKPSLVHTTYPNINLQKTPKSIKTPLKNSKTPQSSIIRKLWNSPSYLDEFYSPLMTHAHHINSYDDDDMILRNLYPSPNILKKFNNNIPLKGLSKNLLNDLSNFDNNKLQDKLKHEKDKAENTDED